jgi:hypothetical protein
MFDDMITTAGSISGAAVKVQAAGAKEIYVAATHGVFCGPALERLAAAPITQIAVTDTIPPPPDKLIPKIKVLTVAPLLAEAIKRIHHDHRSFVRTDGVASHSHPAALGAGEHACRLRYHRPSSVVHRHPACQEPA